MPRKYVDYSRTYIYQLTCKIKGVSDAYISYTTNLTQRKYKHKRETLELSHSSRLYDCIRKSGGWANWKCTILEECSCNNESRAKERAHLYIMKMKPNLNDETMEDLNYELPDFKPNIFADEKAATATPPILDGGVSNQTNEGKHTCLCRKTYAHRSSYYKHTSTCLQFQHNQSMSKIVPVSDASLIVTTPLPGTGPEPEPETRPEPEPEVVRSVADAEEIPAVVNAVDADDVDDTEIVRYRFKSKKKAGKMDDTSGGVFHYAEFTEPELSVQISETPVYDDTSSDGDSECDDRDDDDRDDDDDSDACPSSVSTTTAELLTEQNERLKDYIRKMISALTTGKKRNKKSLVNSLVFELLDQNKTLQKQIVELSKERNIIVNNTNNNQFNLNFFLNEQCKDAVNLSDFVNSLEITMDDLTYTRNQGLVEGISKVMIDGLKQIDLYKRPIHCTDQKRDTIYVRDNHQWARDEGNARMRQAFVDIANKEYFAIKKWMDLHPGWETNSRLQEFHHKMISNVLHEIKDDPIGERKIMKSIEREIFIEK